MEKENQIIINPYNSFERFIMVLLTIITHIFMLPGLFLMKYQKRSFVYYLYIFKLICSFFYHICENLNIIIYVSYIKWNELDIIATISYLNSLLISLTKFHFDKIEQKMMNYFSFFLLLVFQKRGPFIFMNSFIPICIIIVIIIYKLIKYGIPKYNKDNLVKGLFLFVIGIILFFLSLNSQKDYMRIYHYLSHILNGFSFFYLWQIQSKNTMSLKDIYMYYIRKNEIKIFN